MARAKTTRNLFDLKHAYFPLTGIWQQALGNEVDKNGIWLIYGKEKNGKTTFALKLAQYLASLEPVLYVSAEEGYSAPFKSAIIRSGIEVSDNINWLEYEHIDDLVARLRKPKSRPIVFVDNLTKYEGEITKKFLKDLPELFPNKLFVFLAHEERNEPYLSSGKQAKKLAKLIVRVEGLRCAFSGRYGGPGIEMRINEKVASLIFGTDKTEDYEDTHEICHEINE